MKVEVTYNEFRNWPEEVAVVSREDGLIIWCNHAETHTDRADFGYADPIKADWVDRWETIEICDKCDAWRYPGETWEN